MDVYADTVGPTREYIATNDGDQPGDPRKAAAAIATAPDVGDTPRRLVLGEEAVGGVRNKLGRLGDELSRWEKLGREIAFDG